MSHPIALKHLSAPACNTNNSVGRSSWRSRHWFFTLNNYTNDNIVALSTGKNCAYIFQEEIGEKGTPHLQGYLSFKNPLTMEQVKKKYMKELHLETVKNKTAAINYCKKVESRNGNVYTNMKLDIKEYDKPITPKDENWKYVIEEQIQKDLIYLNNKYDSIKLY